MKKLSDYQSELIEKYYDQVYKKVYKYIGKLNGSIRYYGDRKSATDAAIGYIVEAAISFNIDIAKSEHKFITWASICCINNLIDNYRSVLNKPYLTLKRKLYSKIKEEMISNQGYASHKDIVELIKKEHNVKITKREVSYECNVFDYKDSIVDNEDFVKTIEWNDIKEHLIKHADSVFGDKYPLYTEVLKKYIIPKSENNAYPTLSDLSKELNCSESRLSQIIDSDKMKQMIQMSEIDTM